MMMKSKMMDQMRDFKVMAIEKTSSRRGRMKRSRRTMRRPRALRARRRMRRMRKLPLLKESFKRAVDLILNAYIADIDDYIIIYYTKHIKIHIMSFQVFQKLLEAPASMATSMMISMSAKMT